MLASLNSWAHKTRIESRKKPKASPNHEVEHSVRYIAGKTKPSSDPIVVIQTVKDLDQSSHLIRPLPCSKKSISKIVKKVSKHIVLEADEKLCMVDSGAFTHAIDAATELPSHKIVPFGPHERSPDGESACGGIMKCSGKVQTKGTVEGLELNVMWNSMPVKVPILSVRKLVRGGQNSDRHHVRFLENGGYIKNLRTGQRLPFFEYQGVYYLKMKIAPPSNEPDFTRPVR